jgi:predicted transposase/invertase (TIGR01784 family)
VFLPPDTDPVGIVFFCEVQFQKDEQLYERLFGESFLYFYRNRSRFCDWQTVVIYPNRSTEQSDTHPYRALLDSPQVTRIFLDELGDIQTLPLGIALMVLTIVDEPQAPQAARSLLERSQQSALEPPQSRAIMDMITTILVYKFTDLSRQEIEAMLGLKLQETRFYQEAKAEGRQEGRQEAVETLLQVRFGTLDRPLSSIVPQLLALPPEECARLILNRSRDELLDQFANAQDLSE